MQVVTRILTPEERNALLNPKPMTREQVAELVARAKANESRTRLEGFAKQAAANKATLARKRAERTSR